MAVDEARDDGAPGRVEADLRAGVGLEAGDQRAVERDVAGLQAELVRAVVAQVGQPAGRRAQDLGGALDARRGAHAGSGSSIGIRGPWARACSIASG